MEMNERRVGFEEKKGIRRVGERVRQVLRYS